MLNDMNPSNNGTGRRPVFRWSKTARELVRTNRNVQASELRALITMLVEESGNPRWACWRFARRMGIRSKRPQRAWTPPEQQRLLKLIDLHPVNEIAKLMGRSKSSIWHMLYRLGAMPRWATTALLNTPWLWRSMLSRRKLKAGSRAVGLKPVKSSVGK